MDKSLNPLALAIASSLLISTNVLADNGASGAPGDIITNPSQNPSPISLGGSGHAGSPTAAFGIDGASFTSLNTFVLTNGLTAVTLGQNGESSLYRGGGGSGGAGGGSVFGALSIGGAGSDGSSDSSATGGNGGTISDINVNYNGANRLTFTGTEGGHGGAASSQFPYNNNGSGGAGGAGGGSIYTAYSQGGAGGHSSVSGGGITSDSNGGAGGNISSLSTDITNITLIGASGGVGGAGASTDQSTGSAGSTGNGGEGGSGGGSIFAAFSQGGSAGSSYHLANGGNGGNINGVSLSISQAHLIGETAGAGGRGATSYSTDSGANASGSGGNGGAGGGSIFAAYTQGGAGGSGSNFASDPTASGGEGGAISNVDVILQGITLTGNRGGDGGQAAVAIKGGTGQFDGSSAGLNGGAGGIGGGSIIATFSRGGSGGTLANTSNYTFSSNGGRGKDIYGVNLSLDQGTLYGAAGGKGGLGPQANMYNAIPNRGSATGNGGDGGAGGGSVIAAYSQGGSGGRTWSNPYWSARASAQGGSGGNITAAKVTISNTTLNGSIGGDGGHAASGTNMHAESHVIGTGGRGGAGGGSVFAAFSQGGAGGLSGGNSSAVADGGIGGTTIGNTITLTNVHLIGANGGLGGAGARATGNARVIVGADGNKGIDGGSIFGGYSVGGAGGLAWATSSSANLSARGGNGGNASNNTIVLAGDTLITGNIFGGYTQGGNAGRTGIGPDSDLDQLTNVNFSPSGQGGEAINNHITLVGQKLDINGSVFGGFSIDGDVDLATIGYSGLNNSKTFTRNTLTLDGYRGALQGVYNFERFNWILPSDVVNNDLIIDIRGNDPVDLTNTKHTVAMASDGNRLNANDEVVLINKTQGTHQSTRTQVQQGHFIIYDALLATNDSDEFVLRITGKDDNTPPPTPNTPVIPKDLEPVAGRLNPTSKALLQARSAAASTVNHGADMISEQLMACSNGFFAISDGGSSQYKTGSTIKVSDQRIAIGGRKCFDLADTSQLTLGAFAEHGTGNYHSQNNFSDAGKVRGHGDVRYTGGGLVAHMNHVGTGTDVKPAPVLNGKNGLYVETALRAGSIKSDFASNQLIDANNKRAEYKSKSNYASAMLGAGYAWNLNTQQKIEFYSRYTWSRVSSDKVKIGGDEVHLGTDHSSRLRIGTRFNYAATPAIAPYAGLAYEHEFDGKATGKVFEFDIEQTELKGGSGLLEVGVKTLPFGNNGNWHLDAGVQSYFGTRKGATGSLSLEYAF